MAHVELSLLLTACVRASCRSHLLAVPADGCRDGKKPVYPAELGIAGAGVTVDAGNGVGR